MSTTPTATEWIPAVEVRAGDAVRVPTGEFVGSGAYFTREQAERSSAPFARVRRVRQDGPAFQVQLDTDAGYYHLNPEQGVLVQRSS